MATLSRTIGNRATTQLVQRVKAVSFEDALDEHLDDLLEPMRDAGRDPAAPYFGAIADEIRRFGSELIGPDGWRSEKDSAWVHDLIAEVMAMKALPMAKGGHYLKTQDERDKVLQQLAGISSVAKLRDTLPASMSAPQRSMPVGAKIGAVAGWAVTGGLLFPLAVGIAEAHAKRLNSKVRSKLKQAEASDGYYTLKKSVDGVLAKEPAVEGVAPLKPALVPLIEGIMEARNVGDQYDGTWETRAKEIQNQHLTARFFIPEAVKAKQAKKKAAANAQQRAGYTGPKMKKK